MQIDIDRKPYNKQRNYVVNLLKTEKNNFYSNLDSKIVTDNRVFWKTVNHFCLKKLQNSFKINLVEDHKIIFRDDQIAKKISGNFINIPILNMPSITQKCPESLEQDPIFKILDKYRHHPSITLIKTKSSF